MTSRAGDYIDLYQKSIQLWSVQRVKATVSILFYFIVISVQFTFHCTHIVLQHVNSVIASMLFIL